MQCNWCQLRLRVHLPFWAWWNEKESRVVGLTLKRGELRRIMSMLDWRGVRVVAKRGVKFERGAGL